MAGDKDLDILIKSMKPVLNDGDYVFCEIKDLSQIDINNIICFFKESEAITIVLKKDHADALSLGYSFVASWIILTVHSSLEAVGLTAAFAQALAQENISCNVIAGYYLDHIFVDKANTGKAMEVLNNLSTRNNNQ